VLLTGEFSELTTAGMVGTLRGTIAWGDYDNDGNLDALVLGTSDPLTLIYHNNGDGTFTDISAGLTGLNAGSGAWADYDNDGDLDLAISGRNGASYFTQIYRNDDGVFTDIGAGLTGVRYSSLAWGDFDNDGRLDLLVAGRTGSGQNVALLYQNQGNDTFASVSTSFAGWSFGAVAWGDYDNDGDLDLLGSGTSPSGRATRLYQNDGGGNFTEVSTSLPDLNNGSIDWGDYDNDGDLDLLVTGQLGSGAPISSIFENNGDSTFTDISAGLTGVFYGSAAWGDYDNDGDLDALITGRTNTSARIAVLYQNDGSGGFSEVTSPGIEGADVGSVAWGDIDNDGDLDLAVTGRNPSGALVTKVYENNSETANSAPDVPTGLNATTGPGNTVTFSWTASSDDITPSGGLSYNLIVGTTPGGSDVLAPMADSTTGQRTIAKRGDIRGTSYTLNLTPGVTYYWSVQAIDSAWAGSAFATTQDIHLNGEPTLTTAATVDYAEDGPAKSIYPDVTLADDNAPASATLTLTNFVAGQDVLSFVNNGTTMGNISVQSNTNGVLTLTSTGATASLAEWQAALRSITYSNTSNTPDTTTRSVTLVVNDGSLDSNTLQNSITVAATNDAPELATPGSETYTENGSAVAIAPGVTVSDADTSTLSSATVTITNFVAGEDVLAFVNDGTTMGNISVGSNVNGVLTLTSAGATATVSEWQAALRAVTYENTSENPDTTSRSIDVLINDGTDDSQVLTSTVTIAATNDAPELATPGIETYTENGSAVAIAPGVTVSDADTGTLSSATVTITNFVAGEDVLAFVNDGTTMGNISIGSNVNGVLTLTSAGSTATVSEWQAALRAVTYENTSENPDTTSRSIDVVINDGTDDSLVLTSTVTIAATNDAPELANLEPTGVPFVPGGGAVAVTSTLTVADFDSSSLTGATVTISGGYQPGDFLQFTDTPSITGNFDSGSGTLTLTGSASLADYESALRSITFNSSSTSFAARTLTFEVNDGNESSQTVSRTLGGYAQLNGTAITVYGTPQLDVITITDTGILTINVNGTLTQFNSVSVDAVTVYGNEGNDSILVVSLSSGVALTLYGEVGNDSIRLASEVTGDATLDGGEGNDLLIGGSGNDLLIGGSGNDYLIGGDGSDSLNGQQGNDSYGFGATLVNQTDTIEELPDGGTDSLVFATMTTAVTVDLTQDPLLATMAHRIVRTAAVGQAAQFENIFGGAGNDTIRGNAANNGLYGNGGNDNLQGGGGNDLLSGGEGNDSLQGGDQDDVLIGGGGDDILRGGTGLDRLDGGSGGNLLAGGAGDDLYIFRPAIANQLEQVEELADEGIDTLDFSSLLTPVVVDLNNDVLMATMARRIVRTGPGQSAFFENVITGAGNDRIIGNASDNLLIGSTGNDILEGGGGNDILLGGEGDDVLRGTEGQNLLIAGAGRDLVIGGSDGDLLIGGSTVFETDSSILKLLLAEWVSATPYEARANHLVGRASGGLNRSFSLTVFTVTTDSDVDFLFGGLGEDLFLADIRRDKTPDYIVDDELYANIETWL